MTTTEQDLNDCFEAVLKLVEDAGKNIALRNTERKTFVSKTFICIKTKLSEKFPQHKFLGEEEFGAGNKKILTNAPTWIIDPIDGTLKFVHGFPHSCISIALMINKITEIGIIYNPFLNQKFIARRGKGAFYNGRQICFSDEKNVRKALITSSFGTSKNNEKLQIVSKIFLKLSKIVHGIRCLVAGALNMAMVALGADDANFEMGIHIWDIVASELFLREAGGVVLDTTCNLLDVKSTKVVAAARNELVQEIVKKLTQYQPLPRDY